MDDQILKIGKCLCEGFGENCNKCSMNSSPEATECCSVYDEAEQLAKERFVKADDLIEEIFECISDILFDNHIFPGPGEDFEPHYLEDVFEDIAKLKIRLEEKYELRCK